MGAKKIAAVVVLLAVIAAAVVYFVKGSGLFGAKKPPQWLLENMEEKIDCETLELVTLPVAQWRSLGEESGLYKNPKTGKYTMADPMICRACNEKIPNPMLATGHAGKGSDPDAAPGMTPRARARCPKCGKNPYDGPGK